MDDYKILRPEEIEAESFAVITRELGMDLDEETGPVVKRVIHATADFDFARSLYFSSGAVRAAIAALREGADIVTDTAMALSGISKPALEKLGGHAYCFIGDEDVAQAAAREGTTRARQSMIKAASRLHRPVVAIGNAPTALYAVLELIDQKSIDPRLVVGAPVGFVNVVQSKEKLMQYAIPQIVARGRKGGSSVAAAICNALLYLAAGRDGAGCRR